MGRPKRKGKKGKAVPVYDSDDERAYAGEKQPDRGADDYYHDEIDEFHAQKEKILLDKGVSLEPAGFSSDEEEILPVADESDEDEAEQYAEKLRQFKRHSNLLHKVGSDDEEQDDDDALPNEKAWGKDRSQFFGADIEDDDDIDFSGSEPDAALLEEQEALAIQKKLADQFDEQDFDDLFMPSKKETSEVKDEGEEKIKKDLSKLSKKEKLKLLKKESPELLDLIEDFKSKVKEAQTLLPIHNLIKEGKLPASKAAEYIGTKIRLNLNYCININFYLMLKAKHAPVTDHPVIKRIVQYRNLIRQLEPVDESVAPQVSDLLDRITRGEEIDYTPKPAPKSHAQTNKKRVKSTKTKTGKPDDKRKLSAMLSSSEDEEAEDEDLTNKGGRSWGRKKAKAEGRYETAAEVDALNKYEMLKGGRKNKEVEEDNQDDNAVDEAGDAEEGYGDEYGNYGYDAGYEGEDGKRAITREMEKNKGLTPHRKRENRNPRVKHRKKYTKAKIRRKGQIREVRKEIDRYGGEISGIRAGVKKSIKLK